MTTIEDALAKSVEIARRAGEQAAEREAELRRRIDAGEFAGICPAVPASCIGLVGADRCPADPCPHAGQRRAHQAGAYLEWLGFHEEALSPGIAAIPSEIRAGIDLYCRTLSTRIERGEGLTIGGTVGAGKTCALAVIGLAARELPERPAVAYTEAIGLFNAIRERRQDEIDRALEADLWLLDDLGTEDRAFGSMARLHEILNHRWGNRLSTVVTTNLSRKDMAGDVELQRIVDRIESRNPWLWTSSKSQRPKADIAAWAAELESK